MDKPKIPFSRRQALGAMGAALVLPRTALADGVATHGGDAFGTSWRLVAWPGNDLSGVARDISRLFADVDRVFSPWRPDSVLSRFNAAPASDPCRHKALAAVTDAALAIARKSAGAFDPTVGPLVARWGFGPITGGGAPDWRGLSVQYREIRKTRDDLTLDLCGIAKGWALDRAVELARSSGLDNVLIELGGEFAASGRHPGGRDWRLAVDVAPDFSGPPPVLRVPDAAAVATSGVWAQNYAMNGRLYSHIVDPGTRAPIAGILRSVTVIAEDATTADGWATALCAAGREAGADIAASSGIAALFLTEDDGIYRQIATTSMAEFLA